MLLSEIHGDLHDRGAALPPPTSFWLAVRRCATRCCSGLACGVDRVEPHRAHARCSRSWCSRSRCSPATCRSRSASGWPRSRASSAGSCSRRGSCFNLHAVRGDDHDDQRHRRGAVGRQLRRGLVRQAHRLLRELLPGSVAAARARRVATRRRAAQAGRSSTPRTTCAGCRSWSRPASVACGASSSPARPPRSTGGSRAAVAPPSWIGLFAYYALLPFAIVGLVVMRRRRIPILPAARHRR